MIDQRTVLIVGGGGHAKVVAGLVVATGRTVAGFVAPNGEEAARWRGDDRWCLAQSSADYVLANGIGSARDCVPRDKVFARFLEAGFEFPPFVDPAAILRDPATIGDGTQVMAGAIVQPGASVAANTIINSGAIVEHDCVIGRSCHVAPGVVLSGGVIVGDCTHVGVGATVIQGVRIGSGVVVGAGAVVIEDVPDRAVVLGVPARPRP